MAGLTLNNSELKEIETVMECKTYKQLEELYPYRIPYEEFNSGEFNHYIELMYGENNATYTYYSKQGCGEYVTFDITTNEINLDDYNYHIMTAAELEEGDKVLPTVYKVPSNPAYNRDSWEWKDLNRELQIDIIKSWLFYKINKGNENILKWKHVITQKEYDEKVKVKILEEREQIINVFNKYKKSNKSNLAYIKALFGLNGMPLGVLDEYAFYISEQTQASSDIKFILDFKKVYCRDINNKALLYQLKKAKARGWRALYIGDYKDGN